VAAAAQKAAQKAMKPKQRRTITDFMTQAGGSEAPTM